MLIPDDVWGALVSAGVTVRQLGPDQIELTANRDSDRASDIAVTLTSGETWTVQVKSWSRTLTPTIIRTAAERVGSKRVLAIAPTVSPNARKVARQYGWSVLATNPSQAGGPTGVLTLPDGQSLPIGQEEPSSTESETAPALESAKDPDVLTGHRNVRRRGQGRPPGRPAYGVSQVIRLLLTGQPFTQAELADMTALSQPRISQVLRELRRDGLVRDRGGAPNRSARWEPVTWDALLDYWLSTYRGPGGTRTYWYGLEPPARVAEKVLDVLTPLSPAGRESSATDAPRYQPVLSGSVAADKVAPWARPNVAIIYTMRGADLLDIGLTPARRDEAIVHLVVPADHGVWMAPDAWPTLSGERVADPVQILWDLQHGGVSDTDADQAAARLRAHLATAAAVRRNDPNSP